jgi:hypothetical protein
MMCLPVFQPSLAGKDHVIHFAKTPVGLSDFDNSSSNQQQPSVLESIVDFDNNLLCDHVLSVIRMLPGGFFVLGKQECKILNDYDNLSCFQACLW